MSKQEEIREGLIDQRLSHVNFVSDTHRAEARINAGKAVDRDLEYLHSKGVVIRVEKPLADIGIRNYESSVSKMLGARYMATEPLI